MNNRVAVLFFCILATLAMSRDASAGGFINPEHVQIHTTPHHSFSITVEYTPGGKPLSKRDRYRVRATCLVQGFAISSEDEMDPNKMEYWGLSSWDQADHRYRSEAYFLVFPLGLPGQADICKFTFENVAYRNDPDKPEITKSFQECWGRKGIGKSGFLECPAAPIESKAPTTHGSIGPLDITPTKGDDGEWIVMVAGTISPSKKMTAKHGIDLKMTCTSHGGQTSADAQHLDGSARSPGAYRFSAVLFATTALTVEPHVCVLSVKYTLKGKKKDSPATLMETSVSWTLEDGAR